MKQASPSTKIIIEYFRILCEVNAGIGSGSVHLRLGQTGRRFADSTMFYQFVDPQPLSLYPSFGPLSGGTKLTIYGNNLDTGSNTSILIGIYPCKVLQKVSYQFHLLIYLFSKLKLRNQ